MTTARAHCDEDVQWRHLIGRGVAFCVASAIAAIIFPPDYPAYRYRTDSAGEAFGRPLVCVIFGGLGPLITLLFFAVPRLVKRRRSAAS